MMTAVGTCAHPGEVACDLARGPRMRGPPPAACAGRDACDRTEASAGARVCGAGHVQRPSGAARRQRSTGTRVRGAARQARRRARTASALALALAACAAAAAAPRPPKSIPSVPPLPAITCACRELLDTPVLNVIVDGEARCEAERRTRAAQRRLRVRDPRAGERGSPTSAARCVLMLLDRCGSEVVIAPRGPRNRQIDGSRRLDRSGTPKGRCRCWTRNPRPALRDNLPRPLRRRLRRHPTARPGRRRWPTTPARCA